MKDEKTQPKPIKIELDTENGNTRDAYKNDRQLNAIKADQNRSAGLNGSFQMDSTRAAHP